MLESVCEIPFTCHSEERSDEESLLLLRVSLNQGKIETLPLPFVQGFVSG